MRPEPICALSLSLSLSCCRMLQAADVKSCLRPHLPFEETKPRDGVGLTNRHPSSLSQTTRTLFALNFNLRVPGSHVEGVGRIHAHLGPSDLQLKVGRRPLAPSDSCSSSSCSSSSCSSRFLRADSRPATLSSRDDLESTAELGSLRESSHRIDVEVGENGSAQLGGRENRRFAALGSGLDSRLRDAEEKEKQTRRPGRWR